MKIGIITINDFNNFGNRLQCYAVQEYLKKMNVLPENIFNENKKINIKAKLKHAIKILLKYKGENNIKKRNRYFKEFNKNIKFSKYKIINNKFDNSINQEYDYFIVGSDQVWNPELGTTIDASFLKFVDDNKKKNAFSASFGISKLPESCKEKYKNYLVQFNNISVREEAGKEIIKNLGINKDVEVLIDPTMMFDSTDWDKVTKKPKNIDENEKFILNYFLGDLSEKRKKEIERIAKENNCKIINLLNKKDPFFIGGPSEFLWLEKHAFLICTDSFHSSVFAILNKRPFIVFKRKDNLYTSMNSRMDTLLSKFKLEDRYYNGQITDDMLKCDYSETYEILENEREKSKEFLKKALNI